MATDLNVCTHETILDISPGLELSTLKSLGAQGVRIGAVWQYVEPTKGKFTGYPVTTGLPQGFEAVDRAVNAAVAQGLRVNLLLNTPRPSWATPQSSVDWGNFCKQAALRYKDLGVKQFEIGNEWNIGANWDLGPSFWQAGGYVANEIAAFTKSGSQAIKGVIPDAVIVSCGMAACIDWPNRWGARGPAQRLPSGMVTDLANAGVLGYVDKIGYHPYTLADDLGTWQAPTANHKFIQEVLAIHTVLANKGLPNMKIELTEYGWSTANFPEATVGDYIKTEWDILHGAQFAPYVGGHFIYCGKDFVYPGQTYSAASREQNFGMLHQDLTPKTGITSKISAL